MIELTIGIVAEGLSDYAVLEEMIKKFIPGDHNILLLQPEESATSDSRKRGNGWMGVKRFCQTIPGEWGGLHTFMSDATPQMDLLVIQLDGDVARKNDVSCWVEELDIPQNAARLREKITEWLELGVPDPHVVYCLPFDNLETWVLCAFDVKTEFHHPPDRLVERLRGPDYVISDQAYKKPRQILKRKNGEPKKSQRTYRSEIIPVLIANWEAVKQLCTQATAFEEDVIKAAVAQQMTVE